MKKVLRLCVLRYSVIALLCYWVMGSPVMAQQVQQKSQEEIKRDMLISNLNALRNQELRVAVLQQLVNEETAKLLQMQAIFSDQHKLNPDKLRAGMYTYDEKTGQFVEKTLEAD